MDEQCYHCGRKHTEELPLYETGWSNVFWCGERECAYEIMESCCEQVTWGYEEE